MEYIQSFVAILALCGVTVEILPIKINPLRWLGKHINRDLNDKVEKIQEQVDGIEYKNAMKDLADVRNRLISYGLLLQKGERLDTDVIRSIQHDLDTYDYYKDTYQYMELNGRKVRINGEVEMTRKLVDKALMKGSNNDESN